MQCSTGSRTRSVDDDQCGVGVGLSVVDKVRMGLCSLVVQGITSKGWFSLAMEAEKQKRTLRTSENRST